MRFLIRTGPAAPDVAALERALQAHDPAALVDLQPGGDAVRLSTWLSEGEIALAMQEAGYPALSSRLERLPSECCGGCGG
jgi:hypothetical protein